MAKVGNQEFGSAWIDILDERNFKACRQRGRLSAGRGNLSNRGSGSGPFRQIQVRAIGNHCFPTLPLCPARLR